MVCAHVTHTYRVDDAMMYPHVFENQTTQSIGFKVNQINRRDPFFVDQERETGSVKYEQRGAVL